MGGFQDKSLNTIVAIKTLEYIVRRIRICISLIAQNCKESEFKIANNENTIRDYLFVHYLNNDEIMEQIGLSYFRVSPEVPENYIDNSPVGRVDLHIYSLDNFKHRNRYFSIECKRIDGTGVLNNAYIKDGISRFVGKYPKYKSYFKVNGMLGFVVKNIDIDKNVCSINELMRNKHRQIPVEDYLRRAEIEGTYISTHAFLENDKIRLIHSFVDCAAFIE